MPSETKAPNRKTSSPNRTKRGTAAFSEALAEFFRATRRARGRAASRPSPDCISLAQFHLLEPLETGPLTNGQLAEAAGVSSPTATRMTDVLLTRGWVSRLDDPKDRRAVLISLTPEGRRALEAKMSEYAALREQIASSFDPEERRVAAGLLHRLAEVIEDL
jgi:MarR family transcriptional regulator, organic hydroperoxide resistance regulator